MTRRKSTGKRGPRVKPEPMPLFEPDIGAAMDEIKKSMGQGPGPEEPRAHARHSDPETSHAAAESVKNIRESQQFILDLFKQHGPMIDEWMVSMAAHRMSVSGARTRRAELVEMGKIIDTGRREKTKSNRNTIVWALAP